MCHSPAGRLNVGCASLSLLLIMAVASPLAGQRPGGRPGGVQRPPGGRRPAILEVTGEKVAELDPIAKLLKERKKIALSDSQLVRLGSLEAGLEKEIAPFLSRIDSLRPELGRESAGPERTRGRPPRGAIPPGGEPSGEGPMPGGRFVELWNAVAQVKLRYEAAMLSALEVLSDEQHPKAMKAVEKEVARMQELAAPVMRRP